MVSIEQRAKQLKRNRLTFYTLPAEAKRKVNLYISRSVFDLREICHICNTYHGEAMIPYAMNKLFQRSMLCVARDWI